MAEDSSQPTRSRPPLRQTDGSSFRACKDCFLEHDSFPADGRAKDACKALFGIEWVAFYIVDREGACSRVIGGGGFDSVNLYAMPPAEHVVVHLFVGQELKRAFFLPVHHRWSGELSALLQNAFGGAFELIGSDEAPQPGNLARFSRSLENVRMPLA